MIKITVELLRYGNPNDVETLATAKIYNDLTGTESSGNYVYELCKKGNTVWKSGRVTGFARKSRSVWRLIYYILKEIYDDKDG